MQAMFGSLSLLAGFVIAIDDVDDDHQRLHFDVHRSCVRDSWLHMVRQLGR